MSDQKNTELAPSPGALLRSLREKQGLSIADVSTRIYLQKSIIEALEQDDYDNLPIQAYIYGYLQSYAKLLNVPPEQVLSLYKKEAAYEQPEQLPDAPVAPLPVKQGSNWWLRVIIYLFLFVLVLGSLALWHKRDLLLPPQPQPESELQPELPPEPSPGTPPEPPPVSGELDYSITVVEHPQDPFFRAPNTENAESEPASTDVMEPLAPRQRTAATQGTLARADEQNENTFGSGSFAVSTITTGNGPDRVTMVVSVDCWIEVFDADNEKVYYDLARAGQTLQLNGAAPFSVLLGNADAATIAFNNAPFDFTPYITGIGVARFVLGEAQ